MEGILLETKKIKMTLFSKVPDIFRNEKFIYLSLHFVNIITWNNQFIKYVFVLVTSVGSVDNGE